MNEEIKQKAEYCLNCKNPQCRKGCPLSNHIPDFIAQIKENNYQKAYEILCETTVLPAICGRICPHQKQCQGSCIRGIKEKPVSIGELEAEIGDFALNDPNSLLNCYIKQGMPKIDSKSKKVAVVGGGPAGLTASAFLRKKGFKVTIYEKEQSLGGILKRGIPEFRLSEEIVDKTIAQILNLGIEVYYGKKLGENIKLENLKEQYDAVFLSMGANVPRKMAIEGENLEGVFGGNTLLEGKKHPNYNGKKVAIIGGGNVAMDCARTIKRLGAKEVIVIYRRSEAEMPAEAKEIEDSKKEGIDFLFLTNITKILGEKSVKQIECIKTKLVQKEGENRLVPVDIENSNFVMPMDYVIMAVGGKVEEQTLISEKIEMTKNKYIQVDEEGKTSKQNVFAGGDVAGKISTVAWASRDGREVAKAIIKHLETNK